MLVNFGKHLRLVSKTNHVIRGLQFSVPPHNLSRGKMGLKGESISNAQ